jgi:gluconate kinase
MVTEISAWSVISNHFVGLELQKRLSEIPCIGTKNWKFYDGDDFHTQAAKDKMSQGIPLNDDDRLPWLGE